MKRHLASFQLATATAVSEVLSDLNYSVTPTEVQGAGECYLRWDLPGFSLYVYRDEAGIQGPDTDVRLETPDFESERHLREALVAALRATLARATKGG